MTAAGMWPDPFPCEYCSPSLYSSPLSSLLPLLLILVFCLPVGIGRGDRHLTQLGLPAQALLSLPHRPCEQWGLPPTGDWLLPPAAPRPGTREPGPASQCPLPKSSWKLALGRGQELPQTGRSAGVTLPAGARKSQPLIASGCQLSRGPPTPTGPGPDAVSAHVVLAGLASRNAGQPGEEAAWLMEKQRFWDMVALPKPTGLAGPPLPRSKGKK